MSLFGKQKTIYSSASINDDMLVLNRKTRTNMSHSETRIMIDKISSVTHSVVFGSKSLVCLTIGLILMLLGIVLLAIKAPYAVGAIMLAIGLIVVVISIVLRDRSILVSCCGDYDTICVGKKGTDELYNRLCVVLKMQREHKTVANVALTSENE